MERTNPKLKLGENEKVEFSHRVSSRSCRESLPDNGVVPNGEGAKFDLSPTHVLVSAPVDSSFKNTFRVPR
jgi:hypothetical protein